MFQVEKDKNGGTGGESPYWDGNLRNYYPEPKAQSSPDLRLQIDPVSGPQSNLAPGPESDPKPKAQISPVAGSQSDSAPGPQSPQGTDDIVSRQSQPPSEDGSDKGGPVKTKENLDEGKFDRAAVPEQDYDPSFVDVNLQPNVGKSNEGLENKTKNVSDNGGNDIGEKGSAVGEGSQVNRNKQTKNEKENRGTSINDGKEGSWASQVNTNELPVEVFLLFAQHKNASSEHALTLPLMQ